MLQADKIRRLDLSYQKISAMDISNRAMDIGSIGRAMDVGSKSYQVRNLQHLILSH